MEDKEYICLSFRTLIDENCSLEELKDRVEKALQCSFKLSSHKMFEGKEVYECITLGIWITLNVFNKTDSSTTYNLCGDGLEDGNFIWGSYQKISDYILEVLHRNDSADWYLPNPKKMEHYNPA